MPEPTSYDPPRPIAGWHVQATCPECGHTLEHIADGRPASAVARALARCTGCDRHWYAEITLTEAHLDKRRGSRRAAA